MGLYPLLRGIHLKGKGNRTLAAPEVPQMDMGDNAPLASGQILTFHRRAKKKAPRNVPRGSVVLGDDLLSHRSGQYHRRGRA